MEVKGEWHRKKVFPQKMQEKPHFPFILSLTIAQATMNQWTVSLEWNGGMEYWNGILE